MDYYLVKDYKMLILIFGMIYYRLWNEISEITNVIWPMFIKLITWQNIERWHMTERNKLLLSIYNFQCDYIPNKRHILTSIRPYCLKLNFVLDPTIKLQKQFVYIRLSEQLVRQLIDFIRHLPFSKQA